MEQRKEELAIGLYVKKNLSFESKNSVDEEISPEIDRGQSRWLVQRPRRKLCFPDTGRKEIDYGKLKTKKAKEVSRNKKV